MIPSRPPILAQTFLVEYRPRCCRNTHRLTTYQEVKDSDPKSPWESWLCCQPEVLCGVVFTGGEGWFRMKVTGLGAAAVPWGVRFCCFGSLSREHQGPCSWRWCFLIFQHVWGLALAAWLVLTLTALWTGYGYDAFSVEGTLLQRLR